MIITEPRIAYFVSSHGYGPASRVAAINFDRLVAWFDEIPWAKTLTSCFARLASLPASSPLADFDYIIAWRHLDAFATIT